MKIRSRVPLPLGPHDVVTREVAQSMIGQQFPATIEGVKVGNSVVIDVDWRDQNEVWLEIEMDVDRKLP